MSPDIKPKEEVSGDPRGVTVLVTMKDIREEDRGVWIVLG